MKRFLKLTSALVAAGMTLAASAAGPGINAIATTSVDKVAPPNSVSSPVVPNAIAPYCVNTYTSGVEPITLVQISDINNPSSATTGGTAHEDFTAITGTLRPGSTYAVTMKSNTDGAFLHGHALYADWNQDGLLTGADEGYFVGTFTGSTGTDGFSATALITVPASAVSGNTRLRAMTVYNATTLAAIPPCRTGAGFGQSEDYTVNVNPAAPIPPALPNLSKTFTPNNRDFATPTTTLTLNLGQYNAAAASLNLTADLVDTLPVGMTVAATPNASTTCPSGLVTAAPGAGTVTLGTGAQIPPAGCTVTADVQVAAVGVYANSIAAGALQTNAGNGPAATANFTATSATTPTYTVGFETPTFAVANLGTQGGWGVGGTGSLAADWKISTTNPGAGAQHLRTTWTAAGTAGSTTVAISPTQGQGTTAYSIASARLAIQPNATGTTFDFAPQDTGAGSVITRVRFNNDAAKSIQALDPVTLTYLNTGTSWVAGSTYFDLKVITKRSDSTYVLCLNGTQFYASTGFAPNLRNIAIIGTKGTGTNGNILDADNVTIDNSNIGTCNGLPPPHTVTPVVGTPSGSISPNSPVVVADGATTAFTVTPNAGFHIDTVTGCGGSLAANTYTTGPITADCTVTANFAADIVTHTVTAVVGTPSGTITPPSATVNDGATTAFTVTADPGFHINTVTGCGGSLAANTYTTGPITADCTVTANFAPNAGGGPLLTVDLSVANRITITANSAASAATISGPTSTGFYFQNFFTGTQALGTPTIVGTATLSAASVAPDGTPQLFRGASGADTGLNTWSYSAVATTTFTTGQVAFAGTATWSVTAPVYAAMLTSPASGNLYFPADDSTDIATATLLGTYNVIHPGPVTHTVTAVVGTPSGTITPPSATVNDGATTAFTVTANPGFHIDTVTGCGGSLAANTYTTGPITADCTVTANFAADAVTHTVTAVVGTPSGTITPPSATVNDGATTAFTVTANAGFHIDTVTGCGGSLAANTYTTGPITADCTVTANFAPDGGGGALLTVDLSVANQVTVTATSGVSAATVSGATTTGFYFQNFLATAGTVPLGTPTIVGTATLTAASVASDGSPQLFRGASGADAGLNIWSYSAASTTTFTSGQVAFTGTATWSVTAPVYTAMLTAPASGNLYFPADDSTDIAGATLLGTYSVIHPGPANPPAATVAPTSLAFSVASNATQTLPLSISNAVGSDPLTYAIAAQTERPVLRPHVKAKTRAEAHNPELAAKLLAQMRNTSESSFAASGPDTVAQNDAPWFPQGGSSALFTYDDGTAENAIGLGTAGPPATEKEAVYIDRFTATGALTIDSVSVLWRTTGTGIGLMVGKQPNIVVYYDAGATGDPSNAVRIGSDTLVTIVAENVFETYPVNFAIPGAGDVYVGYTDAWASGGAFQPRLFPGSIDTNSDAGNSWLSATTTGGVPTDVTTLANNNLTSLTGAAGFPSNWMIRATGTSGGGGTDCTGPVVTWLTATPASGTVNGGASANVSIEADPTAGGLATGSYTAVLCITTNDPAQALIQVPVTLEVTAPVIVPCSAADEIFCDGFDGGGSSGPATYTDRATFLTHVSAGFYENDFADVSDSSAAEPARSYSQGGFGYTIDTLPDPDDLWFFPGVITTNGSADQIIVTFTSGSVTAVGGNFYASDIGGAPIVGNDVVLTLSDGTTETFSTAGDTDFRGFTTALPITSITIDAPNPSDPTDSSWSTLDNMIVGTAQ